jgi:protein kinase
MEGYKILEKLGDGAYGCVSKAINTKTGETVAIKVMKQHFDSWQECLDLREVKSLRKLVHPNIIKLKEV